MVIAMFYWLSWINRQNFVDRAESSRVYTVVLVRYLWLLLLLIPPLQIQAEMGYAGDSESLVQHKGMPPDSNPHPPTSEVDKKRVAFAEQAARSLITAQYQALANSETGTQGRFRDKDAACIQDAACLGADRRFVQELTWILKNQGALAEVRHAHIIPWSFRDFLKATRPQEPAPEGLHKRVAITPMTETPVLPLEPDEYMVHLYVRYQNSPDWYHLNVILTEDSVGNLYLRHFYTIPMPAFEEGPLPPGVVC